MRTITMKNFKKIKFCTTALLLFFCTIVSGFGLLTAPESDEKHLEAELKQNEEMLEQMALAIPKKTPGAAGSSGEAEPIISVIGDSVFLGAAPSFKKIQKNAVINAKVSRQVRHGLDVAKKMDKKGTLGDTVILSLGTNGNFNPVTGQELIDYLGKDRTIYWINIYGKNIAWKNKVNKQINELAKKNSNVHVIPWAKTAKKHSDWFYQDGTHLNAKGQNGFAEFIRKSIS